MDKVVFITTSEYSGRKNYGILWLNVQNKEAWNKLWNIGEYYEEEKVQLALQVGILSVDRFEALDSYPESMKVGYKWYKELLEGAREMRLEEKVQELKEALEYIYALCEDCECKRDGCTCQVQTYLDTDLDTYLG